MSVCSFNLVLDPLDHAFRRTAAPAILGSPRLVNILYLENHAIFARQVTQQFLRAHRVTVVPTLAAARIELAAGDFDLVLLDYDLDDGKGETFVRECRASHPRLPIVAVSSHEDADHFALLAVLYEHFSNRNLAEVVSLAFGRRPAVVSNDIAKCVSIEKPVPEALARVKACLQNAGFEAWSRE